MSTEHDSVRTYLVTFVALLLLLGLTVGVAFVPLGLWNSAVAMTVATVKMVLIVLFFMHLYESDKLMWIFALSGLAWLFMLLISVVTDVFTREQGERMEPARPESPAVTVLLMSDPRMEARICPNSMEFSPLHLCGRATSWNARNAERPTRHDVRGSCASNRRLRKGRALFAENSAHFAIAVKAQVSSA